MALEVKLNFARACVRAVLDAVKMSRPKTLTPAHRECEHRLHEALRVLAGEEIGDAAMRAPGARPTRFLPLKPIDDVMRQSGALARFLDNGVPRTGCSL